MKQNLLLITVILMECLFLSDIDIHAQTNTNVQAAHTWVTAPNWQPGVTNLSTSRFELRSWPYAAPNWNSNTRKTLSTAINRRP